MRRIQLLSALFIFGIVVTSCKKDPEPDPPVENDYPSGTLDLGATVTADFFGRVIDENGSPISGATVVVGSNTTTTDHNGVYKIDQATVNTKLAYVKVTKSGYFIGAESIIPDANSLNYSQITMFSKQLTTSTVSEQAITVTIANGVSVDLSGRYTDQFGLAYSGGVNVYARYIAPNEIDVDKAPGSNYGQGGDGVERYFESYGMILLELEGYNGQVITIAPGTEATVRVRIDASQISNAPAGVPMAYFDQKAGYWVEDGWADINGDEYVGTVSHIDHWNMAAAHGVAEVHGDVQNHLGDSLSNFLMQNSSPNGAGHFYTSSNGTFRTYIPADITIDWSVLDDCGNATVINSIGPYGAGTPYTESIQIPDGTVDLVHLFGDVLDCGLSLVSNGYVVTTVGSSSYAQFISDGNFMIDMVNCEGIVNYDIVAHNMTSEETSINFQKTISSANNLAGTIIACDTISEYLSFSFDGGSSFIYTADITCNATTGGFVIHPSDNAIIITSEVVAPGGYDYYASAQPNTIWVHPADFNISQSFSIHTDLLEFGNGYGEIVALTFSGFYTDLSLVQHTIAGDLVVFRDQ